MSVERLNSTDSRVEVFKKLNEAIERTDDATPENVGTLRVASNSDEKNCSCNNAALTPSNLYDLINLRKANTGYAVGDTVGCAYHNDLQLKCIFAGITENSGLDTSGELKKGQTLQDGTVIWEVKKVGSGANVDLSNLSETGEKHFLNKSQITNCLLEVPQKIKLELNDGVLTLKAGSKVIVPNGVGVFDEMFLSADSTATQTANDTRLYFYNGRYIEKFPITQCHSGETAPTGAVYMFWYDTTNNLVKKTSDGGATWETGWSLPFAICTAMEGALKSIDQVFNGMGYIGSTVWIDKDVKGLIPNGRNEDGTLKNVEVVTDKLAINNIYSDNNKYCGFNDTGVPYFTDVSYYYNKKDNTNNASHGRWDVCVIADISCANGEITNFQPKQPVKLVRHDELQEAQVVVETYVNGTSWYRVWSDGWVEQGGNAGLPSSGTTGSVTLPKAFSNTNYTVVANDCFVSSSEASAAHSIGIAIRSSSKFDLKSSGTGTGIRWYACGY